MFRTIDRTPVRPRRVVLLLSVLALGPVTWLGLASARDGEAIQEQSFHHLMDQAMMVMEQGMRRAPMNGDPDHDFATAMIPHHQGAIDMARAELLYGKDPVLRRLAQEIIVTQQQEIAVMQRQLDQTRKRPARNGARP